MLIKRSVSKSFGRPFSLKSHTPRCLSGRGAKNAVRERLSTLKPAQNLRKRSRTVALPSLKQESSWIRSLNPQLATVELEMISAIWKYSDRESLEQMLLITTLIVLEVSLHSNIDRELTWKVCKKKTTTRGSTCTTRWTHQMAVKRCWLHQEAHTVWVVVWTEAVQKSPFLNQTTSVHSQDQSQQVWANHLLWRIMWALLISTCAIWTTTLVMNRSANSKAPTLASPRTTGFQEVLAKATLDQEETSKKTNTGNNNMRRSRRATIISQGEVKGMRHLTMEDPFKRWITTTSLAIKVPITRAKKLCTHLCSANSKTWCKGLETSKFRPMIMLSTSSRANSNSRRRLKRPKSSWVWRRTSTWLTHSESSTSLEMAHRASQICREGCKT